MQRKLDIRTFKSSGEGAIIDLWSFRHDPLSPVSLHVPRKLNILSGVQMDGRWSGFWILRDDICSLTQFQLSLKHQVDYLN